ncbi:FliA/WhiG family RNA polymerase sigma factor [Roseateles amylovorans]|uniref:FliA/WhiG family RNA polymerase sigma factor n=1 Tax=Roseateles amylovorans TaxID=2978473 RepID=A0ABY6B020_9BURK|nr:FliA/WhiG family RNA polymerase sigma factor [Roseateles amylovorans]UXH76893.1 FliA/WhiG family RNA polymerase sigma factor [Roseateles amylovorans]
MQHAYAEWGAAATAGLSADLEQRTLREYAPLVKRVVRQLSAQASAVMDREDMEQIGLMGLLEALRRYGQPDGGFGPFAALRVRGAILDELRRQDWRPRTVRQGSHKLRDALRALTRLLGREPTEAEILQRLQLTPQAYQDFLQAEVAEELASFDELVEELAQLPSDHRSPEAQLMVTRSIAQALSALNEREQRVIQLYYEFDASLKEIAAVLDLTEARVSQINKAALAKMRAFLQQG